VVAICCSPGFTQLSEQVPRTWYVVRQPTPIQHPSEEAKV